MIKETATFVRKATKSNNRVVNSLTISKKNSAISAHKRSFNSLTLVQSLEFTYSLFWELHACDSFHTAYSHFSRTQCNRESTSDRFYFLSTIIDHYPDTIRTQSNLIELNRTYRAQSNAIERSIGFDCSNFL